MVLVQWLELEAKATNQTEEIALIADARCQNGKCFFCELNATPGILLPQEAGE